MQPEAVEGARRQAGAVEEREGCELRAGERHHLKESAAETGNADPLTPFTPFLNKVNKAYLQSFKKQKMLLP